MPFHPPSSLLPSLSCFQHSSFQHRSPVCTERYPRRFACIASLSRPHPSIALGSPHRSGSLPEFVSSHMVPHHDTNGATAWSYCTSFGLSSPSFLCRNGACQKKYGGCKKVLFPYNLVGRTMWSCVSSHSFATSFLSVWELAWRGCASIGNCKATLHTFSGMLFGKTRGRRQSTHVEIFF